MWSESSGGRVVLGGQWNCMRVVVWDEGGGGIG